MTAQQEAVVPGDQGYEGPTLGVAAIQNWSVGYLKRHPLASLTTVGAQFILFVPVLRI